MRLLRLALVGVLAATVIFVAAAPASAARNGVPADFDCDGVTDQAIGQPTERVAGLARAGAVWVRYGGGDPATVRITQNAGDLPGDAETGDEFGFAVAARPGPDGCSDLIIGAPGESVGDKARAGTVWVVPGGPDGLDLSAAETLVQGSSGLPGSPEAGDEFGYSVAGGLTRGGGAELVVIGAPGESHNAARSGSVYYRVGAGAASVVHQDTAGVPGAQENGDRYGETLALSSNHLVIGAPQEAIGSASGAGLVHVFRVGSGAAAPTFLAEAGQNTGGISGTAEAGDRFGASLSIVDFQTPGDTTEQALLAVGSPDEAVGSVRAAGTVNILHLAYGGTVTELKVVDQGVDGVSGSPETDERFGAHVRLVNRGGDPWRVTSYDNVIAAIGVPGEELTTTSVVGVVQAFRLDAPTVFQAMIQAGAGGMPANAELSPACFGADRSRLYTGFPLTSTLYAMSWSNLWSGAEPEAASTYRPYDDAPVEGTPVPGCGAYV